MKQIEKNDLFQTAQLSILLIYTIFSGLLIGESFLMGWEPWPLVPIVIGNGVAWMLHIQQRMTDEHRIQVITVFIMFTFFFYGSHETSTFDTVAVMSVVMILYTMFCIKPLITILQLLYYLTLAYDLLLMWNNGTPFDVLLISRTVLHVTVITAISFISRMTIDKWLQVLDSSHDEIEKLTESTERLNDFLANVSHETRTPINAIIGLTGICIDEEQNTERRNNLLSVRAAGRRVAEQISDILDFTEIDRKKLTNNYEDYMLSSVLNDLVNEIRPYKPKEIELIIDVDPAIPSVLNTDISKLRKILRHLIMNGIKYTREGGIYVRLYTIKEEYGVNLVIKVTDTGIGMTEEELEHIFERYYQADSGRNRQGGGLGLGMTIVSGFTASLGGFLTVDSKPGEGTTVTVSIPQKVIENESCMSLTHPEKLCLGAFLHLDKYPDPHVREYYNMMIRNIVRGFGIQMHRVDHVENLRKLLISLNMTHLFVAEEEYATAPELIESLATKMIVVVIANDDFRLPKSSRARIMEKPFYCFPVAAVLNAEYVADDAVETIYCPGLTALAVDDDQMNLTVAQNILRRYGMTVVTANSGMEAVELCKAKAFDIVFMDHMMPGMDGVETMKRIRANNVKEHSDMPIVALTANAVSTARESFIAAGFDGFVSKPIELIELERVLKKVLPKSAVTYRKNNAPLPPEPAPPETVIPEQPPEPAVSGPQAQSVLERLAECGLDTAEGLRYSGDDEEFYISLLMQLAGESGEKREKMNRCYAEKDLDNYAILVHAMKSTMKMIGCDVLSERAKTLEFAAKNGEFDVIAQNHDALMADYRTLTDQIQAVCGGGPVPEKSDADEGEIFEFLPDSAAEGDGEVTEFLPGGEEN